MEWESVNAELQKKLDPAHVKPPAPGKYGDYIEGWHAIAEANRIFGHGGWTYNLDSVHLTNASQKGDMHHIGYMACVTVTVGETRRGDVGHGQGHGRSEGDAHDSAVKEAVTDALKRALRSYGNPFGLALYDKSKANVGRDVPQVVLDAAQGAETLDALIAVWNANSEWKSHPDFKAAKDNRKSELQQKEAA
jgi:DNA repair and recombination protein RAD52